MSSIDMPAVAPEIPGFRERHASTIRQWRLYAHLFAGSFSSMLGLGLVVLFLVLAIFGPVLAPYPEDTLGAVKLGQRLLGPSFAHPFGTDEMGADILSRVIVGARTSLWIGLVITGIGAAVGVPLGIIAGYKDGIVRAVIMRITDLFLSVPGLALALSIVAALGPGIMNCVIALSIVWWPGYVRLVQAKTLSVKEELYVESARALGARTPWILWHHILPNCMTPIVVKASMDMGMAILSAASLGFIGLGAKPPHPEWGAMISVARTYMPDWWWYSAFPGLAIFLTVLGFNLLGDGLRDILDPRSRGR
ncbi:ABC transporter permease [Microvirga brassicacearum]|uniref:ABC transporter permease n=1 Tax=Microvirga brassicacearum TaxID=2580413 RepID=A0A5N3P8T1_9HYPH|nr:ABC transporter permease [Microvirga brassicacearum]KAB0266140.1 ABC transporter permease [Microvirga brassicacearum]